MKNRRQACFACTTPYQVLGAISITKQENLDADLYIFGMFSGYEKVAEKLRDHAIFANVYAADATKTGAPTTAEPRFMHMTYAISLRFTRLRQTIRPAKNPYALSCLQSPHRTTLSTNEST